MSSNNENDQTKVIPSDDVKQKAGKRRQSPDSAGTEAAGRALFDSINSYRRDEMTANEYWERIFYVHLKTKELYILAEEYGSERI